ncbi:MAG: RidA family protein [Actinomycetes bacterium]|jgi:2-iminobutanoate/2-iminopropanoate deaminase|nr:MAG: RidA family protein [Actinomycetota bacterium]
MKVFRDPETVHAPLAGYSHQVLIEGERLLVLSGQVGMTPDGTVPEDPVDQLGVALDNVVRNLEAAGMTVRDLVKLTIYAAGELDPVRRREAFASRLGDHRPAMTLVHVAALASPALKVEVDAMAAGV